MFRCQIFQYAHVIFGSLLQRQLLLLILQGTVIPKLRVCPSLFEVLTCKFGNVAESVRWIWFCSSLGPEPDLLHISYSSALILSLRGSEVTQVWLLTLFLEKSIAHHSGWILIDLSWFPLRTFSSLFRTFFQGTLRPSMPTNRASTKGWN